MSLRRTDPLKSPGFLVKLQVFSSFFLKSPGFDFGRFAGLKNLTQPEFTCSKLMTETLEQGIKYGQS